MDQKRRAALIERREKLQRQLNLKPQLGGLDDLRGHLVGAGEDFEIFSSSELANWTPNWIPRGYSRIPWDLVSVAEETWFKEDQGARDRAFSEALAALADPEEKLLFVFEGEPASFAMKREVANRHAATILADRASRLAPIWVTSPKSEWLVEVSDDTVRVGDTMAKDINCSNPDDAGRAAFETLCNDLTKSSCSYVAFRHDDPERPELPHIIYEHPIPPLRVRVPATEKEAVRSIVFRFLEKRAGGCDPIQIILAGAPRIQLSLDDFEAHYATLYGTAPDFNVSGPAARWLIGVRRRSQTWIEGVG